MRVGSPFVLGGQNHRNAAYRWRGHQCSGRGGLGELQATADLPRRGGGRGVGGLARQQGHLWGGGGIARRHTGREIHRVHRLVRRDDRSVHGKPGLLEFGGGGLLDTRK